MLPAFIGSSSSGHADLRTSFSSPAWTNEKFSGSNVGETLEATIQCYIPETHTQSTCFFIHKLHTSAAYSVLRYLEQGCGNWYAFFHLNSITLLCILCYFVYKLVHTCVVAAVVASRVVILVLKYIFMSMLKGL